MLRRLAPFALLGLALAACDSGPPPNRATSAEAAEQTPTAQAATGARSVVSRAEALIGERFKSSGWIEDIVAMEVTDNILRVTLDRSTGTLSALDAYTHMCQALSALIATEGAPGGVVAVQFFRADGSPVVASSEPNTRCTRFAP